MKNNRIYLILTALCLFIFCGYLWQSWLAGDSTPPVITLEEAPLEVSMADPESALLQGVTAVDDKDGDVTDSILVESITLCNDDGLVSVVYAAFDRAGNVTKAEREVRYTDYRGPRFELSQPLVFIENSGFDVLRVVSAEDYRDGDISQWIRATALDGENISGTGDHKVQLRVNNSLGDTAVLELPVEVHPAGTFHGDLVLRDYLVYRKVGEPFDETDYPVSYSLGPKVLEFSQKLPENIRLEIDNQVDTQTPGVYTVTYTLTYSEGAYVYTGYSKLFVVVEG